MPTFVEPDVSVPLTVTGAGLRVSGPEEIRNDSAGIVTLTESPDLAASGDGSVVSAPSVSRAGTNPPWPAPAKGVTTGRGGGPPRARTRCRPSEDRRSRASRGEPWGRARAPQRCRARPRRRGAYRPAS